MWRHAVEAACRPNTVTVACDLHRVDTNCIISSLPQRLSCHSIMASSTLCFTLRVLFCFVILLYYSSASSASSSSIAPVKYVHNVYVDISINIIKPLNLNPQWRYSLRIILICNFASQKIFYKKCISSLPMFTTDKKLIHSRLCLRIFINCT